MQQSKMLATELSVAAHTYNLSTWEAEEGGSQVSGHPELHSETLPQKTKSRK
jgi:hypothetical protein